MTTGPPLFPWSQYRFTPFSNEFTGTGAAPVTGACRPIVIVVAVTPVVSPGPEEPGWAGPEPLEVGPLPEEVGPEPDDVGPLEVGPVVVPPGTLPLGVVPGAREVPGAGDRKSVV